MRNQFPRAAVSIVFTIACATCAESPAAPDDALVNDDNRGDEGEGEAGEGEGEQGEGEGEQGEGEGEQGEGEGEQGEGEGEGEGVPVVPGLVTFGAAGDFGGRDDRAGVVMQDLLTRNLSAFFLIGDVSYAEIEPESAWCDWVHDYLGPTYPMQLIAGNHEEDSRVDGFIRSFADCMPDRLGSELGPGGYTVNYATDLGPVTMVAIAADLSVDEVDYTYEVGSPERVWLESTIRAAKAEGDWVAVGMHKNCITIGNKNCAIGEDLVNLLIDEGVDLVLQGHDHDYQRSHSLASVVENGVGVVADDGIDGAYQRGAGTVFVIVGTVGRGLTTCSHSDSEAGNFAAHWCGEEASSTLGYVLLTADAGSLGVEFITAAGEAFNDTFVIE